MSNWNHLRLACKHLDISDNILGTIWGSLEKKNWKYFAIELELFEECLMPRYSLPNQGVGLPAGTAASGCGGLPTNQRRRRRRRAHLTSAACVARPAPTLPPPPGAAGACRPISDESPVDAPTAPGQGCPASTAAAAATASCGGMPTNERHAPLDASAALGRN